MAHTSWGHGGTGPSGTGIGQLLFTYSAQGGELFGARRWVENPLKLTHVLWRNAAGQTIEAMRQPNDEAMLSEIERDIWIQLALHLPQAFAPPTSAGQESSWMPLTLDQALARELVQRLNRDRASRVSNNDLSAGQRTSAPSSPRFTRIPPISGSPVLRRGDSNAPAGDTTGTYQTINQGYPSRPSPIDTSAGYEVSVLPCIEVELPAQMPGASTADHSGNFAREVAVYFSRATRVLPQVREARGWLRGGRLVLAVRVAVAAGGRPATQAEMTMAGQWLADVLARHTLPYSRMGFADPGEWAQGMVLTG